eukprot:13009010-Alexandrium_andersonii.AAC.1
MGAAATLDPINVLSQDWSCNRAVIEEQSSRIERERARYTEREREREREREPGTERERENERERESQ